jgi:hypothetical protein
MKSKLMTAAGTLLFLVALGHFGAKPLIAQIRAALVRISMNPGALRTKVPASVTARVKSCSAAASLLLFARGSGW